VRRWPFLFFSLLALLLAGAISVGAGVRHAGADGAALQASSNGLRQA